jgi:hypothetical protein
MDITKIPMSKSIEIKLSFDGHSVEIKSNAQLFKDQKMNNLLKDYQKELVKSDGLKTPDLYDIEKEVMQLNHDYQIQISSKLAEVKASYKKLVIERYKLKKSLDDPSNKDYSPSEKKKILKKIHDDANGDGHIMGDGTSIGKDSKIAKIAGKMGDLAGDLSDVGFVGQILYDGIDYASPSSANKIEKAVGNAVGDVGSVFDWVGSKISDKAHIWNNTWLGDKIDSGVAEFANKASTDAKHFAHDWNQIGVCHAIDTGVGDAAKFTVDIVESACDVVSGAFSEVGHFLGAGIGCLLSDNDDFGTIAQRADSDIKSTFDSTVSDIENDFDNLF